jgi:hypothetical protein
MKMMVALLAAISTALAVGPVGPAAAAGNQVVVPHGAPVQIAVMLDKSDSIAPLYTAGVRNAIQMAVQLHPRIHGFPIRLNDSFDAPCLGDGAFTQNLADATAIVANPQNVAVLGPFCSAPLGGVTFPGPCSSPPPTSALSVYEQNGVVLISGSTTNACLPAIGPTVFNTTIVPDPGSDLWYSQVTALPSDRLWQLFYRAEFGVAPTPFADLYFDATRLLLTRLDQTARSFGGQLVIDRQALARAVRQTTRFPGVTCTISLDPATGFRIDDQAALAHCAAPFPHTRRTSDDS